MSKKMIDSQSGGAELPFFAHLLTGQSDSAGGGQPAPTYHCLDQYCTKKFPSDGDEPTSTMWDK